MPGENKRYTGARKSVASPDLDLERRPEGGHNVPDQQEKEKGKPYGLTEPLSDTRERTRHADGVNPGRSK